MAVSYMNTTEVENISKEILELANELNTEFNNLFKRFAEVPNITREWVGTQSQFYFNRVAADKVQYINFVNKLRDVGYKLSNDVYEMQNCILKNNNAEAKKGN